MPSYTPRRVSAERDFPPGCGPGAVLTTRNRPTPYSRPPSVQRHPPTYGRSYLLALPHQSNGGGEAVMELTTALLPAAPDATTTSTVNDEEEEEEEEEDDLMPQPPEIDYEDQEEVFVPPSPGVGGLLFRIPREHTDYDDMYYDDGVSAEMIGEFLRTMSSEEAAEDGGDEKVCVVCQDDLCGEDRTVGILECGHRFHADCVGEWLLVKNVCPLCKAFGIGCFT